MYSRKDVETVVLQVQNALKLASEYERLKSVLDDCNKFEDIREFLRHTIIDASVAVDDPDYYITSIEYIMNNWAPKNQTEIDSTMDRLREENAQLKEKVANLEKENRKLINDVMTELYNLYARRDELGDYFVERMNDWIVRTAKFIEQGGLGQR